MAKKNYKKEKDIKEESVVLEEMAEEKAEAIEKIAAVLKSKDVDLDKLAEKIAPEFDFEEEAKRLEFEQRGEAIYRRRGALPPALVECSVYPRTKKPVSDEASWIRKTFLRDRHQLVLGLALALAIITIAWQSIDYAIPETVHVSYASLDEMKSEDFETRAKTVGDFQEELIAAGYEIKDGDSVVPAAEAYIRDDMDVMILDAYETTAKIAGHKTEFMLIPGTVEDNLKFNNVSYDDNDKIKPALDKEVNLDTKIVVDEIHYVRKTKTEKVEAQNVVVLDPSLTSGVEQRSEGNDGEGVFKYKYTYVNGKKVKTDKEVKEWIVEPHNNELRLGTSATGHKGTYRVVRTFTANCTAYTAPKGAGGALGEGVHVGTCAVDPTFVSYRSQMWIAGYGYAYANDCGGAVKGNIVDLFMNTTIECIRWGRRNCTAYVLEPIS